MEFIDFWLGSCKSYFRFITCQSHTGSLSWTEAITDQGVPHGLSSATCCETPLRALLWNSHPDARRGLRATWEQTLAPCPPAAAGVAVPGTALAMLCLAVPWKGSHEGLCTAHGRQRVGGPAWEVASPPRPSPPPALHCSHTNYDPFLPTAMESLKTWTRCRVSPGFTDSLEAITLGGINYAFHRNKMLMGGKPCCSRQCSTNTAAAPGKKGFSGLVSAMPTPVNPPCPQLRAFQMSPLCGPHPRGRGCLPVSSHPARGPAGPKVFGEGCGQQHAGLFRRLS